MSAAVATVRPPPPPPAARSDETLRTALGAFDERQHDGRWSQTRSSSIVLGATKPKSSRKRTISTRGSRSASTSVASNVTSTSFHTVSMYRPPRRGSKPTRATWP